MQRRTTQTDARRTRATAVIGCLAVAWFPFAAQSRADSILLRKSARVEGAEIRVKDVADLDGAVAATMGDVVIPTPAPTVDRVHITIESLRQTLTEHRANWAKLSLRGFAECVVERVAATDSSEVSGANPQPGLIKHQFDKPDAIGPAAANPTGTISTDSPLTIGSSITDVLRRLAGGDPNDLLVTFADRDSDTLNLSIGGDRIEMDPMSRAPLGRVPVVVRRYREGKQIATYRVTADIARRTLVVVATRSITRGHTIEPDDVTVQQVELRTDLGEPMTSLADVVGQRAMMMLRKDAVIDRGNLGSPIVVERGELVTIHCVSGGLSVKTVGRAIEAGGIGETIEVRNERSRKSFMVRVTGRQTATLNLGGDVETTATTDAVSSPAAALVSEK